MKLDNIRKEPTTPLQVEISSELKKKIEKEAVKRGVTYRRIVETLLRAWVEKRIQIK